MGAAPKLQAHPLMSEKTISIFIESVQKVLQTMAATRVTPEKAFLQKQFECKGVVSAIVGITAPPLKGNFILTFSQECIVGIYNNMLGENQTSLTDEVKDSVGEIANMIYGNAKTGLNEQGHHFQMAIPAVVVGEVFPTKETRGATLVIPFKTAQAHQFYLQIIIT